MLSVGKLNNLPLQHSKGSLPMADATNEDRMERDRLRRRILATTILIGAAIGLVVGILGDYIGVAVAVGVAVGLAVGGGIYQRR